MPTTTKTNRVTAHHVSLMGSFANTLRKYADRDGFLPGVGDEGYTPEFVEAYADANAALQDWRIGR